MTNEELYARAESEARADFEKSDKQPNDYRRLAKRLQAIQRLAGDERYSAEITDWFYIAAAVERMNANMEIYNRKGK